jgi:hypothetical protein
MATKTIKTTVTVHVPAKGFVPFEYDTNGGRIKGEYKVIAIKPGDPVTVDADEADYLIKRFGGEVVSEHSSKASA